MNTAERIVWGLLSFIVLIGWLRWHYTPQDEKKSGASPEGEDANPSLANNHQERNFPGPQVHKDQSSSSLGPTRGSASGA